VPLFPFKECPSGLVDEETFKTIYSQFFPQGGKYKCFSLNHLYIGLAVRLKTNLKFYILLIYFFIIPSDATTYAHFLFNAFDLDRNGSIRFEVRISLLINPFHTEIPKNIQMMCLEICSSIV